MKIFVQFEAGKIVTVFGGEPDRDVWPDYSEVEEDDPQYLSFMSLFSPSPEQVTSATKDELMRSAALKIAPLQYAVDLKIQTPSELNLLKAWKEYSVALNRVQDQSGFPESVVWPETPSNV